MLEYSWAENRMGTTVKISDVTDIIIRDCHFMDKCL